MGISICNFITVTLPMTVILLIIYSDNISLIYNTLFFLISIIISIILVFNIDYIIGLTAFYTEVIWGVSITKNLIISILAGAVVPISLFPEILKNIIQNSPFYSIYQIPIDILTSSNWTMKMYLSNILIQVFWMVLIMFISKYITNKAMSNIRINGG